MLTALILSFLAFTSDSLRVSGNCYNVADQTNEKCNITVVFSTSKQKINVDQLGKFAFELPDSARQLTFELAGFETRNIGVNRIGKNRAKGTFEIKVPMLKNGLDPSIKEDETIFPKSQLFVQVDAPDTETMSIVLMDETTRKVQENRPIVSSPKHRTITTNYVLPGAYTLYTGIFDKTEKEVENSLSKEKVVLNEGFNFLFVRYENAKTNSQVALQMLTPRTLYFDQSSYHLRKDSRLVLDSVCAVLVRRHNLIARVTGHTDNVGKQSLNLILSEYRARVVQHYMKTNGVRPGQIRVEWKGSYLPVAENDREENKSKNRRVEISFREQ
ncbi:OmpA family protein [Dyadobacter sp. CY343]|uniref:OmpA family protein n=1 Tax=Dyadobacter sp. CY343 TaxID=2907299 RepID=UPI001F22C6C1|nr:OmpA family protein [Dyadobacter sp. CY343]MCE7059831.1 OmpA family protein [Dyadobacter sp. CY343]